MEFFSSGIRPASLWLLALAILWLLYAYFDRSRKPAANQLPPSLLSTDEQAILKAGGRCKLDVAQLDLAERETCLWRDRALQDYYQGHEGILILTDRRLVFLADGFQFDHPLKDVQIRFTRRGFVIEVWNKKMPMRSAEDAALRGVWESLRKQG